MSFDGVRRAAIERITAGSEGARLIGSQLAGYTSQHVQGLLAEIAARVLPPGGTVGQVLKKTSSTDYVTAWQAESAAAVSSVFTRTGAVAATSGDYTASQVTNTPAGNIAATTVQAALNELDSEKATPSQIPAIASQAQADTGTDDTTIMTPLKTATRPQKNVVFETFIDGLTLVWASPGSNFNNLTVTPGAAWIPSLGKILNVPSTLTATAGTPAASTWYYVYLYDNSGTPALDVSTTAPAAPYKGAARAKTSDTSRRFLAAARTDGSGVFYNFIMQGDLVKYRLITNAAPFRALNGGTSTTATAVACNTVIPPVSQIASIRITNGANVNMQVDNTDATGTGSGANGMIVIAAGVNMVTDFPLNTSQELRYWMLSAVGSGSAFVDVYGYVNAR